MSGSLKTVATSGSYTDLTSKPTIPVITTDTGWTGNSGAGDKTVALTNYANGLNGTMVTALNLVSVSTGTALSAALDALVLLNKKVQAIETALVSNKLPNA